MPPPDPSRLASLRARIWALEGAARGDEAEPLALAPALDQALPWGGLPRGRVHGVLDADGAGAGFAAVLLARLARLGPVVWCAGRDDLYGPGLAAFGLQPDRLVLARGDDDRAVLWAMEEALRCSVLGGVLGEVTALPLTAGRRLQLAAEAGGVTGLVLLPARPGAEAAGCTTRWRVATAPSAPTPWNGLGAPRWRVSLERCRNGSARDWLLEWDEVTATLVPCCDPADTERT